MAKYKVLHGIIMGARTGETVELSDDDARAYGPEYVQKLGKDKDPEDGNAGVTKPNKDKAMKGVEPAVTKPNKDKEVKEGSEPAANPVGEAEAQ